MAADVAVCLVCSIGLHWRVGDREERSRPARGGNEGDSKRGPRRVFNKKQQYLEVGAVRVSMVDLQVAERRRDNARPTPQRHRTRLLRGLSTLIPWQACCYLESQGQSPLLHGHFTAYAKVPS
jgi:hypothetical protein